MNNRVRATLLAIFVALVVTSILLYAGIVVAAEVAPEQVPSAVQIGTGGAVGGVGVGGVVYFVMHGRMRSNEERVRELERSLASLAPQMPALVAELRNAIDDFKAAIAGVREAEVQMRGKIHDVRDKVQRHEGMFIRVHERFNALRDVVIDIKGSDVGVPKPLTDEVTGQVDVDTGRHRSLGRSR